MVRDLEALQRRTAPPAPRGLPDGGGDPGEARGARRHRRWPSGRTARGSCSRPTRPRCSTSDGDIAGAVNILIDVTDQRQAGALRAQAMRCRRLAQSVTDQQAVDTLLLMAAEYDDKAAEASGATEPALVTASAAR